MRRTIKVLSQLHHDFKKSEGKFLIQKKIFYRECLLLLSTLVDQKVAIEMLAHDNHLSWSDKKLKGNLG